MSEFKQYRRKQIAELRPVTLEEAAYKLNHQNFQRHNISVSNEDIENGSPKLGDMIARNPKNYKDQWLVSEEYYKDNFEELN